MSSPKFSFRLSRQYSKVALALGFLVSLAGCNEQNTQPQQQMASSQFMQGKHYDRMGTPGSAPTVLSDVVSFMADQLSANKDFANVQDTPIAVTSFVNVENLSETNKLGIQLQENMIHEMQVRGYRIVDFKTMGSIRVNQQGDFAFSRKLEELTRQYRINYVLTGTYTGFPDGVMINARMIDLQSKVVMSSAQGFLPTDDVEGIMGGYDATRNFKGKIIEQHVAPSVYLYNTKLVK
ncbi:FlgO family outer membrane protein [Pokkaliibacter sp. MBI-7]|uniref:FlgO family outer membrane protein n=1 Tax=Pokkaliibacter sp. MBI-7 TaxID=3040600 RepID=UPI00244816BE|nr:FlgO family outer membrane protein [Pokkaliibacter sp. MBI-7]MDH2432010.1 FlgO family outer membrane protein [Pokkaliibacter sp. MBI-7]